jgi:hypothetical protein
MLRSAPGRMVAGLFVSAAMLLGWVGCGGVTNANEGNRAACGETTCSEGEECCAESSGGYVCSTGQGCCYELTPICTPASQCSMTYSASWPEEGVTCCSGSGESCRPIASH